MSNFIKLRPRRISIFYMLILLANYVFLSQEEINRRKMQLSTEDSDNYIKLFYSSYLT